MDDVLVFAETLEECQERTKRVLDRMKEEDLHLKLAKCAFDQTEVEYLGLVVKNGEILMDPTKLKAVEQWEPPKSVKAVRSFIGFCNFYRKFIPHFSAIARPLIALRHSKDTIFSHDGLRTPSLSSSWQNLPTKFGKSPLQLIRCSG